MLADAFTKPDLLVIEAAQLLYTLGRMGVCEELPQIDEDAALSHAVSFASNRQNAKAQSIAFSRHFFDEYGFTRMEIPPETINLTECLRGMEAGFLLLHQQLLDMGCFVGHDLAYEFKEKRGRQAIILKRLPWTRSFNPLVDGPEPPPGWNRGAVPDRDHRLHGGLGWGSVATERRV